MNKYTKIPCIFKRDTEGTKRLIEGDFISEEVALLKDMKWTCTEKVDGTNIGVVWDGHKVSFQGRTENAVIQKPLKDKLTSMFGTSEAEELFEQKFGEKQVILFGEGYGKGIGPNGSKYIADGVSFIMFDVYFPEQNLWGKRDAVEDIAKAFGCEVVPVIIRDTLDIAVQYVKLHPKSAVSVDVDMEGLVCTAPLGLLDRRGNRIIVKVKGCDF